MYKLWNALEEAKKMRWVELSHPLDNDSAHPMPPSGQNKITVRQGSKKNHRASHALQKNSHKDFARLHGLQGSDYKRRDGHEGDL